MKDTGAALLADTCARPDDPAVRLIYADWLEEHGGQPERAEVIRLAVQRRQMDDLDPEAWVLDSRRGRLAKPHQKTWEMELPKLEGVRWHGPYSGVVEGVAVYPPQVLLDREEAIFSAGPIANLEYLVVQLRTGDPIPDTASAVARCRFLWRIRHLHIGGMAAPETSGIDVLARCPDLANVRTLELWDSAHEDDFLEYLASCPAWPSLERLSLYHGWFTPPGLRALANAPILASLRSLNLSRSHVQSNGLRELLRSPHLRGLRELKLSENGLDSRVIENLVEYPWQCLERLDLSANELTTPGVRHLAGSSRLATVRKLDLGAGYKLGDDTARVLAKSPHLRALVELDLGWWKMTPRGIKALATAPWLRQVRRLRLCGFHSGMAGLELLADVDLSALRWLDLCYSQLTGDDLQPLLAAPWLPGLTHLDLNNNALGATGARVLAEAPGLESLVLLDVTRNKVPDETGELLRQRFGERVQIKSPYGE